MSEQASDQSSGTGQAGRNGQDVRSDAHVEVQIRKSGGLQIEIRSKVELYYGTSIREEAERVAVAMGIDHAKVVIEDRAAFPFCLSARLEAAARRAGARPKTSDADPRPERSVTPGNPSTRDRRRRSRLYLPGNEAKFFVNAALHGPDAIILDLEDSVHPARKDEARLLVRNALRCVDFGHAERMVRINQLPLGLVDLDAVVPETPDLILIPKVESAEQVQEVDARIDAQQRQARSDRPLFLMPILESALGVERAFEIARACERVVALTIGLEDYTADLGVPKTREGDESLYARQRLVNAAHAAGVQAIDSVYGDVADDEGLRHWADRSRRMGFTGMGCVHPRQIGTIHECFAPSAEEIERAQRIVEAFEAAQREGRAVVSLGSRMIDPPVVKRAQRLVEEARRGAVPPPSPARTEGEAEK